MLRHWGKTNEGGYHLLAYHSLDVAACAVEILRSSKRLSRVLRRQLGLTQDQLERFIGWAAVMHDLGKLSPSFQRQDVSTAALADLLGVGFNKSKNHVRHDSLGWILWSSIERAVMPAHMVNASRVVMRCSTGHHGKPPSKRDAGSRPDVLDYFNPEDIEAGVQWSKWALEFFKPEFPTERMIEPASWLLAGVITLADWLGSSVEWNPYRQDPMGVEDYYRDVALQNAARAIELSGVSKEQPRRTYKELFPTFEPTPIQQAVNGLNTDEPFFLVIEETTGGGKTEAALAAAGGSSFFFGLPTMATANGLWRRVGQLDGQQALIHGKSWAMPGAMDRATAWLADGNRKALLADIGVGTVDQAMIAVMYARYGTLRLVGLAGKTLVIDEVHAYDTYMKEILQRLIEVHASSGGAVILLSATMPLSHRQDYADAWARGACVARPKFTQSAFPLVTFINQDGLSEIADLKSRYEEDGSAGRRIQIEHCCEIDKVYGRIESQAKSGKCVAWIRNTVAEATQAYETLLARGVDVSLFHSRFAVADRSRIESEVLDMFGRDSTPAMRKGKVLIATQVIEQSLDIDFDFMVSDLCPIDLLIQRAGRMHRHTHRGPRGIPVLMVFGPRETDAPGSNWVASWSKNSGFVYSDHSKLWLTQQLIADGFSLPGDARRLVEGVFGAAAAATEIPLGLVKRSETFQEIESTRKTRGLTSSRAPEARYEKSNDNLVWDDTQAPTRLGERANEWVLFEKGEPISGDVRTSTISIEARKLSEAQDSDHLAAKIGKWQKGIDLRDGVAYGAMDGKAVSIRYSRLTGLVLSKLRS